MVVNADAPLAFLLYKAEELPSYLRPHVAHRLMVCESQRLRSHEHRDAKHHQKYNFFQIHLYKVGIKLLSPTQFIPDGIHSFFPFKVSVLFVFAEGLCRWHQDQLSGVRILAHIVADV